MARQCDSKNLHMSPLCDLQSNQGPSLWQGEVVDTYRSADGNNENLPDYIKVNSFHILPTIYTYNTYSIYWLGYSGKWFKEKKCP